MTMTMINNNNDNNNNIGCLFFLFYKSVVKIVRNLKYLIGCSLVFFYLLGFCYDNI